METRPLPKSYLSEEDKADLLREGGPDAVYLGESHAADNARDSEASWAWLALAELPSFSLLRLKRNYGAQFIRDMGFKTATAEEAYGPNWLETP